MSWDNFIENSGYWLEVASRRMARRALHTEVKSLSKMAEDSDLQEWISFLPEKSMTKSLKRDIAIIVAKELAEKATRKQSKESKEDKEDKVIPDISDE